MTNKCQQEQSKNMAFSRKLKQFEQELKLIKSVEFRKLANKKNLVLFHILKKKRLYQKTVTDDNSEESDSSSVEEEMDIREEKSKLIQIVDQQKKQIRNLFEDIEDLQKLERANKILKLDKKRLKKLLKQPKKFW